MQLQPHWPLASLELSLPFLGDPQEAGQLLPDEYIQGPREILHCCVMAVFHAPGFPVGSPEEAPALSAEGPPSSIPGRFQ